MNLQEAFNNIKQSFMVTRDVDLGGTNITLVPLTAEEEIKVMESCKEFEGSMYLVEFKRHTLAYSIRKVDNVEVSAEVDVTGDDGKPARMTRVLFILKMLQQWDSTLRDTLYEAYSDLLLELDAKVSAKAKFNRFAVARKSLTAGKEEEVIPGFKKVEESKADMTEAERMSERVKQESDKVQMSMAQTEQDAVNRVKR